LLAAFTWSKRTEFCSPIEKLFQLMMALGEFVSQGYGGGENKTAGYGKRLIQRLSLAAGQLVKVVRNR
jgi:hypothetical protein